MKLDLVAKHKHKEICTSCTWAGGELYTTSDDQQILKWGPEGELLGVVATLDAYVTSIAWAPDFGTRSSVFAVSCTDGTVRFYSMAGGSTAREDKKVSAHTGATISVKWSPDGSALISTGEDGDVKLWSKSGNLRSTLAQNAASVYAFVWGPDGDSVLWASGKALSVKSASGSGRKPLSWRAHKETVLCVDWNRITDLVVSGGEDCVYKVWDSHGRQLYSAPTGVHVVTSVAWMPSGEAFAVGSFQSLRLCDKTGWSHARERPQVGSLLSLAWTPDGTELAGAGGSGGVVFGQLVQRRVESGALEAVQVAPKVIVVSGLEGGASDEAVESLEFPRDRVVEFALGYGKLVVATTTQCFLYTTNNLNTPHIFDLRAPVQLILLAETVFLMMDANGINVYNYQGRAVSSPRFGGLKPSFLNKATVSLSDDVVAVLDRVDSKTVRIFDVATGKALGSGVVCKAEVASLSLSKCVGGPAASPLGERRLAIVDRNRDLHLAPVTPQPGGARGLFKLSTQVDSMRWCDTSDMLCAVADGRFLVWHYPNVVFVDRDLLPHTLETREAADLGQQSVIASFAGLRASLRKADGAMVVLPVSNMVPMLHSLARERRWEEATRLCRFVKDPKEGNCLWAVLAATALHARQLDAVEIALAALTEVDKLEYIQRIKNLPSEEARSAEIALYRRCPDEAEAILLQASPPLLYRAVKLNCRLFRWGRALDLALKHKKHVDTVLGYRAKYLLQHGTVETSSKFKQYASEVEVNWEAIKTKIKLEKDDEKARSGGGDRK